MIQTALNLYRTKVAKNSDTCKETKNIAEPTKPHSSPTLLNGKAHNKLN